MSYYNTTQESPDQVKLYNVSNEKQDDIVLRTIKKLNKPFSCSQIYKAYPIMNTPLTSLRRSVNTLKKRGIIKETGIKVKGIYNRAETQYQLI